MKGSETSPQNQAPGRPWHWAVVNAGAQRQTSASESFDSLGKSQGFGGELFELDFEQQERVAGAAGSKAGSAREQQQQPDALKVGEQPQWPEQQATESSAEAA